MSGGGGGSPFRGGGKKWGGKEEKKNFKIQGKRITEKGNEKGGEVKPLRKIASFQGGHARTKNRWGKERKVGSCFIKGAFKKRGDCKANRGKCQKEFG